MNLVRDLAVILISAGVFTIISKALKQPLILGYIVAGILIGPHVDFYFGISSTEAVHQWAEIGMIFMMFGLGLEFSFKKLLKVGKGAIITAGCKFLGVFVMGFVTAQAMGWSTMESIFLGGLLSMSSTTVIVKCFDELGLKSKPYAQVAFGTIILEDLIAILLMVLLTSLAVSKGFAGGEMAFNLAKLAFFLILWFLVGIFVIPTLLKKAKKYLNSEILLIVSIGLCFGMVAIASAVGFSSALGAFVMGSILSETIEGERIDKVVTPLKDLFGAIFFVSVGMMVSPADIVAHWATILIITLLVWVADIIFVTLGGVLAGKGLENGLHTGFSLAQLGEFGFIIAGVGCSLGVMRGFIYPVIIAVSVITTFTTPYLIRAAGPAYSFLSRHLPQGLLQKLSPQVETNSGNEQEQSEWKKLLKAYALRITMYGVVIIALDIASRLYLEPLVLKLLPQWSEGSRTALNLSVTLLVMGPFFYGLGVSTGAINNSAVKLLKQKKSNALPIFALILLRSMIAIGAVLSVVAARVKLSAWAIVLIIIAGITLIMIARHYVKKYTRFEQMFINNLNEKEKRQRELAPVSSSVMAKLGNYDVHLELICVSPDSEYIGQKLKDLPLRSITGANIIKITRGSRSIIIPSGDEVLYPMDALLAVGSSEQIDKLKVLVENSKAEREASSNEAQSDFTVNSVCLGDDSPLCGKKLSDTNMRQNACMVVSVARGNEFTTNPAPDFVFESGDLVWIAGQKEGCDKYAA